MPVEMTRTIIGQPIAAHRFSGIVTILREQQGRLGDPPRNDREKGRLLAPSRENTRPTSPGAKPQTRRNRSECAHRVRSQQHAPANYNGPAKTLTDARTPTDQSISGTDSNVRIRRRLTWNRWKERAEKSTTNKPQTRNTNTTSKASPRSGTNDLEQATAEVHAEVTKYPRVPTVQPIRPPTLPAGSPG